MANLDQVMQALRAADAAGNVDDARRLAQIAQRMKSEQSAPPPVDAPPDTQPHRDTLAEQMAYAPATRFAAGVGETLIGGPFQLGANLGSAAARKIGEMLPEGAREYYDTGGDQLDEKVAEKQRAWNDLKQSTMGDEWDVAGGVGAMAAGVGAMAPGATSMKMLQPAQKLLSTVPATLGKRVLYGAGTGAAMGAMTPQEKAGLEHNTQGAVIGGAIGGAFPALVEALGKAGKVVYHAGIEPRFESGRTAIKGRAYLDAGGERIDDIAAALRSYVPKVEGSDAPAGEAAASAGSAEFSAMQNSAEGVLPSEYVARGKARDAARLSAVRSVGGDDEALALAGALRDRNAANNYGKIRSTEVAPQADDALMEAEIANSTRQKAEALQMAGKFQTDAAQQESLARGGMVAPPATNTGTGVTTVQPRGASPGSLTPADEMGFPTSPSGYPEQRVTQSAYPAEGLPTAEGAMRSDGMPGSAYPVPGQPRVPPRYTENAQRVPEARAAIEDAMSVYETRKIEENWLRDMQAKLLEQSGGASKTGLEDFINRPSIQDALGDARKSAAEAGLPFPKSPDEPFSIQNLQDIKESLDRGISAASKAESAGRRPEVGSGKLASTRDNFVAWLESKSPEWGAARTQYREDSAPINQMKVGQFLEGKLTNALDEEAPQRAAAYANALRDAPGSVAQRVTGTPRFQKLTEVLNPEQLRAVESVRDDLASMAEQQRLARAGSRSGKNVMQAFTNSIDATGHSGQLPNLLSRPAMAFNFIMRRLKGQMDEKLAREIAQEMLDPKATGQAIERAITRRDDVARTAAALRARSTQGGALAGAAAARASAGE